MCNLFKACGRVVQSAVTNCAQPAGYYTGLVGSHTTPVQNPQLFTRLAYLVLHSLWQPIISVNNLVLPTIHNTNNHNEVLHTYFVLGGSL